MWNAMAKCYEQLNRPNEAKKCCERAERVKDKEGIALHKLAKLYVKIGELENAAQCFRLNLKRKETVDSNETSEALLFLAKFSK